jgi:hypothetical protein
MLGFEFRKSLNASETPQLLYFIADNSDVITVGDAVKINTDGHAELLTAGAKVAGVVAHVVDANGLPLTPDSGTLHTYTMPSDNETVAQNKVGIYVGKDLLFANDSSGSLATTNLMQFFDVTDEDTINQGSASDTAGQFQLVGLDPDGDGDASKGLFKIAESQFDPFAQQ